MQMTAVNWLLYKLTKSPLQLGINGLFRAVPAIALGIFSGALADRYDRKKLLLTTQCLLGIARAGAWHARPFGKHPPLAYLHDHVSQRRRGFVRRAGAPSVVSVSDPEAVLPNAVALNSMLWKGAALLGPMLGGIAISLDRYQRRILRQRGEFPRRYHRAPFDAKPFDPAAANCAILSVK